MRGREVMFRGYNLVITIILIILSIILFSQLWYVPSFLSDKLTNIIYNISMSYIVSYIFYLMLVYLPDKKRQNDIREHVKSILNSIIAANDSEIDAIEKATKQKINIMRMTEEEFQTLFINKIKMEEKAPFVNRVHFTTEVYEWDRFLLSNLEYTVELKQLLFTYMIYLEDPLIKILNNIIISNYYQHGKRMLSTPNRENQDPKLIASYLFQYHKSIEDLKYYRKSLG